MQSVTTGRPPATPDTYLLLTYVADLELEVDRLRKQGQFLRHEVPIGPAILAYRPNAAGEVEHRGLDTLNHGAAAASAAPLLRHLW